MGISFISELWLGVKCCFQKPVTLNKRTILEDAQKNCSKLCLDANKCIKCKSCVYICPNKCIQIIDIKNQDTQHFTWNKTKCANCRLCEKSCPKGAIFWTRN